MNWKAGYRGTIRATLDKARLESNISLPLSQCKFILYTIIVS